MAQASAGLAAYLGLPAGEPLTFAEDELIPVGGNPGDIAVIGGAGAAHRPELEALREGQLALDALARAEPPASYPICFCSASSAPPTRQAATGPRRAS